jgi:spermidine synthase
MGHSIDIREEAGIRYLHFGTDWVQGAMRLSKPHRLELAYTQAMLAFLLFRPAPRNVLIIGLGAA